jgi:hypothetical protein
MLLRLIIASEMRASEITGFEPGIELLRQAHRPRKPRRRQTARIGNGMRKVIPLPTSAGAPTPQRTFFRAAAAPVAMQHVHTSKHPSAQNLTENLPTL